MPPVGLGVEVASGFFVGVAVGLFVAVGLGVEVDDGRVVGVGVPTLSLQGTLVGVGDMETALPVLRLKPSVPPEREPFALRV